MLFDFLGGFAKISDISSRKRCRTVLCFADGEEVGVVIVVC